MVQLLWFWDKVAHCTNYLEAESWQLEFILVLVSLVSMTQPLV